MVCIRVLMLLWLPGQVRLFALPLIAAGALMQIPMRRVIARRLLASSETARGTLVLPTDRPLVSIEGFDPYRVLLVGSGPAAGVGSTSHVDALAGTLARYLSEHSGRGAVAESRATVASYLRDVPAQLESIPRAPIHAVIVSAGMMEAVEMVSDRTWERWLLAVLEMVQCRFGNETIVLLAGMPAPSGALLARLGRRTWFIDRRAAGLNRVSRLVTAGQPYWRYAQLQESTHLDGQPTPTAYLQWAEQIGEVLTLALLHPRAGA